MGRIKQKPAFLYIPGREPVVIWNWSYDMASSGHFDGCASIRLYGEVYPERHIEVPDYSDAT